MMTYIKPIPIVTGYPCSKCGKWHVGYLEDYQQRTCMFPRGYKLRGGGVMKGSFEKKDMKADKKAGIKENSKKDKAQDKKKR